ncbi:MAG TPA: GAF domain-containing protein [Terriglobales bacterium]|nr:GAF domain-containing protein [Terriglobales bacterium]
MNLLLSLWTLAGAAILKLTPQESAAFIMLAASLVVFRTFRERYLLIWILGWIVYLVSRLPLAAWEPQYGLAIAEGTFVLAVCVFAAAVFSYTRARKLFLPLLFASIVVVGYAVVRPFLWPDSITLRLALEVAYRVVAITAVVQLIKVRWGRWEIGPWLLSLSLLSVNLDWAAVNLHLPAGVDLIPGLLLGLSMLLVVFDDSRARTRRLAVVNALTTSIARSTQSGPMLLTALEELKKLMKARAAWFRLQQEDEKLVVVQQIGLSPEFMMARGSIATDETMRNLILNGKPAVIKTKTADPDLQNALKKEKFHHVLMVPVRGKKSVIGVLALGSRHWRSYTPEDLEFLETSANQLGIAVENVRLMEQVLRSQRQWVNTFDSIQDLILVHDAEFKIMKVNQALVGRLNLAPAAVVGNPCETILSKTYEQWKGCPYCSRGDVDFVEGSDPCFGGYSLVSTSSYTDQNSKQKGTIHVIRDTTERRAAEEKYRLLFEQVQEGVFVATPEGRLVDCNDAFVQMLGYKGREELMVLNLENELYASPEQRELFRREMEKHNYVRNFEVTMRRKDGTLLNAVESSFASRNAAGRIDRYQGFLLDMTEKKRAEEEIRRRNRELNALNAMAVIATQSFDLDEILNLTLRQVVTLFGAETGSVYLSDADNTTLRRRAGWGQRSGDRQKFSEVALPGGFGELVMRSRTEVITHEFLPHLPPLVAEFVQADGLPSWIWVLLWSKDLPIGVLGISCRETRTFCSNDENLLVAIGRQLATTIEKVRLYEETCRAYDDLRKTQEQLLQSEKMSAVGQLIAGVAHELNNPLTAILGYAQLLESEGLQERAQDYVRKMFKQAQRTHRVVQNLLSFARQRKSQKQEVDLRKVLDETLILRDYDLKVNNIAVEREIDPNTPNADADPHQLEQVFLNIINNALDAMLENSPRGTLKVKLYPKDKFVCVEFQDSGPGIQDPKRIFDPFYTTKSIGKGTGLGLSICYGIVKEHGGDIVAHNRPEGGAVLEVRIPICGHSAGAADREVPAPKRELVIEGYVLVVEEEEAVLEFERDVLVGAGAKVATVTSGDTMKERLLAERFDALVTNGTQANWGAREMYQWLKEKCPDMENRVLFTFSTAMDLEMRGFLQSNNLPFLVKPFEVADLITAARKLLQKTQAAAASGN